VAGFFYITFAIVNFGAHDPLIGENQAETLSHDRVVDPLIFEADINVLLAA
jgi:hypothetical protein